MSQPSNPLYHDGTVAVVLNWNGAEFTLRAIQSLLASRPRAPHLLVVDNGSTDGSIARIQGVFPDLRILDAEQNLGYAAGNNLAIRVALEEGAARVVLINNDVEVDPDMIARLEGALDEDARVGVVGPLILFPGPAEKVWAAGGELAFRENVTQLRGFGHRVTDRLRVDADVGYIPGCVLMARRDVLERVGLLEESFFCYMEDVEFGHRVRDAGYRNRYVASARAIHDASSSTGGGYTAARKYMNAVNSVHYLRLHPTLRGWTSFVIYDVLGLPACFALAAYRGRISGAFAKLRGIVDGLAGVHVTPERVAKYLAKETPRPVPSHPNATATALDES